MLLNQVIEGAKRAIDSLTKRSEQFLKLHRASVQNQKQVLNTVAANTTIKLPLEPKIVDKRKYKQRVEKYIRGNSSHSFKKNLHDSPSD